MFHVFNFHNYMGLPKKITRKICPFTVVCGELYLSSEKVGIADEARYTLATDKVLTLRFSGFALEAIMKGWRQYCCWHISDTCTCTKSMSAIDVVSCE